MRTQLKITARVVATGLFALTTISTAIAQDSDDAGIVRISDGDPAQAAPIQNSGSFHTTPYVHVGREYKMTGNRFTDWRTTRRMKRDAKRTIKQHSETGSWSGQCNGDCSCESDIPCNRLGICRKFGYFHRDGCCGEGCPKCGHYGIVYANNPGYHDPRDGKIYAAQGLNVPVAMPLAPNVEHTYNYGWGIPSSRRTHISRLIPEANVFQQP